MLFFLSYSLQDSSSSVAVLLIYPDKDLLTSLPFWMRRSECFMLALAPRSKAHSSLYDNALHVWKNENKKECPLKILTGKVSHRAAFSSSPILRGKITYSVFKVALQFPIFYLADNSSFLVKVHSLFL